MQTLYGHSNSVISVAFSHDGTRVASGSYDSTVKIWDASSGTCLKTLDGHSGWVSSVAFSHDGTRVASGSDDDTVKIWDASSDACLKTLDGYSSWVSSVAFSHDGTRVASGSYDSTVKIWDASSGACLKTLKIGRTAFDISFDTTGLCLLTNIGTISLDMSSASDIAVAKTTLEEPRHHGYGLSAEGAWITWNDENVLWLPSEYRPSCLAIALWAIIIGCRSGQVLTIKFSFDKSPLSNNRSL
jgi:WD40 repeat protein